MRFVKYMRQVSSATDSEQVYSPNLEAAFQFILEHPLISDSPGSQSFKFIMAARFLKRNAPHLFQVRQIGAESENHTDRWLWDLLSAPETPAKGRGGS
jgi:hypothetical protein